MVKLVACSKDLPDGLWHIISGDLEFDIELAYMPGKLSPVSREYMKQIDGAVIVDEDRGYMETRFGITGLSHLSTGLKVLLLMRYYKEQGKPFAVNLNECGNNVLRLAFRELDDTDNIGVLYHLRFNTKDLLSYGCEVGGVPIENDGQLLTEIMKQRGSGHVSR